MVLSDLHTNMPPDDCHWTLLKICQHWYREWLGAVKPQAISWANVDLIICCHLVSLGCNELNIIVWSSNHCFKSMVATGTCWIVSLRITIVPSCKVWTLCDHLTDHIIVPGALSLNANVISRLKFHYNNWCTEQLSSKDKVMKYSGLSWTCYI